MRNSTLTFLKVVLVIISVVTLGLCTFALPFLAGYTAGMYPEYAFLKFPILIGLYFTVIPFFFAIYESYKLLNIIRDKNAFSESAMISLRHIMVCAITIINLYVIGFLVMVVSNALHPGIAILGLVIIFASLIIAVFSAVLRELLRSAIELKAENELTV